MKEIGVIVVDCQSYELNTAQLEVLNFIERETDEVILLLTSNVNSNNLYPLDYETKKLLFQGYNPNIIIEKVNLMKDPLKWSNHIDHILTLLGIKSTYKIVFYTSPKFKVPVYTGRYRTTPVDNTYNEIQKKIVPLNSKKFRKGIIYQIENRFGITYPTVDIAVLDSLRKHIILGRKEHEDQFRFVGGFVDPTDLTLEDAAKRECTEELGKDVVLEDFKYICSRKINDFRYRGSKDGIMTTFFKCELIDGTPIASDDIFEVKSFSFDEITEHEIVSEHRPLFKCLMDGLYW